MTDKELRKAADRLKKQDKLRHLRKNRVKLASFFKHAETCDHCKGQLTRKRMADEGTPIDAQAGGLAAMLASIFNIKDDDSFPTVEEASSKPMVH